MRLPGVEAAVVDVAKIREYLLSDSHPVGRFKSTFYRALGYTPDEWETLAEDLRVHASDNDAVATERTVYGQKYEVHGRIRGPAGKTAALVTVWIVLHVENHPRFVTAFPGARS